MTTQINVKLEEQLLREVDALTKVLHISRSEWLRNKIAYAVKEEALHLREAIVMEYARGHITEEELEELLGADAEDVKYILRKVQEGKGRVDEMLKKCNI